MTEYAIHAATVTSYFEGFAFHSKRSPQELQNGLG